MSDFTIPPCLPDEAAGPDVIYSSQPGPVVQVDGACFSRPVLVESISAEDGLLIVGHGTNLVDCARVTCGRVGLYCYESVAAPLTAILVLQPLYFPSPVVALASNRSRCYQNPSFVKEVIEDYGTVSSDFGYVTYGSYAIPVELATCGVSYLYESCNGNEQIIVVDESSPTVYYGGQCWTNPQVVVEYGTDLAVIAGTDVTAVSGCSDVLCSGSDASGESVSYTNSQVGQVNVQFAHLDLGIPYYGIAPEKNDDGESGLAPGSVTITFDANRPSQTIIQSVPASGRLEVKTAGIAPKKWLVLTRGGSDTTYVLPGGPSTTFLDVEAGDKLRLALAITKASTVKIAGQVRGSASWKSAPKGLRQYDEVTLDYVGTTAINAVGFCGLAARTEYAFFGTLPIVDETVYPNPDTYLTVQGATGPEYVLVASHAQGDRIPPGPNNTAAYDGGGVVGPLVFRFYTGRGAAGAHGEMDVWLDTPGVFPEAFVAGRYSLLARSDSWYRRTAQVGDTRRSALTVAQPGDVYALPGVYASAEGRVKVVDGLPQSTFTQDGTVYNLTGTAYGLAYEITQAAQA